MSTYDPHHGIPYEKEAFEALIATPQPHGYVWRDGMLYAMPGGSSAHTFLAERLNELIRVTIGWRGPCHIYRDKYVEIPKAALTLMGFPAGAPRGPRQPLHGAELDRLKVILEALKLVHEPV